MVVEAERKQRVVKHLLSDPFWWMYRGAYGRVHIPEHTWLARTTMDKRAVPYRINRGWMDY